MAPKRGKAVDHPTSLESPHHLASCCCSSQKSLLYWLWRQINTTRSTCTCLTMDLLPNLEWQAEIFAFLAVTLHMGHTVQGRLEDYWTKLEQLRCPFYGQMMVRWRYCQTLWFLHFTDSNRNGVDRTGDSHNRLWKSQDKLFKILQPFSTFCSWLSHCEIQGKVNFQTVHHGKKKKANFWHENIQTVWLHWLYIWHGCVPW